jgi:hypothetical protein
MLRRIDALEYTIFTEERAKAFARVAWAAAVAYLDFHESRPFF